MTKERLIVFLLQNTLRSRVIIEITRHLRTGKGNLTNQIREVISTAKKVSFVDSLKDFVKENLGIEKFRVVKRIYLERKYIRNVFKEKLNIELTEEVRNLIKLVRNACKLPLV